MRSPVLWPGAQKAEAELGITASLIMCFMTELSPDEATKTLEQVRRVSMSKNAGMLGSAAPGMG